MNIMALFNKTTTNKPFAEKRTVAGLREMSYEEIDREVLNLQRDLLSLRINKASRQEFKPSDFKKNKRLIAQLLTVRREKQISDGISKAEYRWEKTLKRIQITNSALA